MPAGLVLAIDQGTTNTKAVLMDAGGAIAAQGAAAVPIEHPRPGWVQQDATAIWDSVLAAVAKARAAAPDAPIAALGISNQRESIVIWDRATGRPRGPVISWQCRRTTAATEALKAGGAEPAVLAATGLPLDPLFPALKLRWLVEQAGGPAGLAAGTVDSWLIWNLTGGRVHAIDRSNAARTQLLDVRTGAWSAELCELFGAPLEILPTVRDSAHVFGHTAGVAGLPDGIPVAAAIGDSHAALFGHCAFTPGDAKVTFGTGCSVMATIPAFRLPERGLTTTIAWSRAGRPTYALEGNILVSASALPWTADLLGLGGDVEALLDLAQSVPDTAGVALVPAFVGLGAPHWASGARGLAAGLSFASGRAHVARAAAMALAHQAADVLEAMAAQSDAAPGRILVDGGASRSEFLMGLVAGLLGRPVLRCDAPEASARGAAYLAGLATGVWDGLDALAALPSVRREIAPALDADARAAARAVWDDALARCLLPAAPHAPCAHR